MEVLLQDLRYAARSLRKAPGFTLIAVVSLTLGIGANTAIFSVIDTLLLRPPRFEHLDRLVSFQERNRQKIPFDIDPSPGNFLDWREHSRSFDHLSAWRNWYFTLADPHADAPPSESVRGVSVSPSFFSMLGVDPALGRAFESDEEVPGKNRSVILSDGLWRRRFGADRTIIGRTLLIDGAPFSVVGVLPRDFQFFQPDLDLWMPLAVDEPFHDRQSHSVMVFGRLAPGISLAQAQADMDGIAEALGRTHPDTNAGWHVSVQPLYPTAAVRELRPALLVLMGAAGLVLLIACANVANLVLARAIGRQKEMAVRTALGASRARLIRQMLTESLALAIVSGAASTVVAYLGVGLLVPLLPHIGTNRAVSAFRGAAPVLDIRMLGFSFAIAVITAIGFGLVPAFRATRRECLRLRTSSAPERRTGQWLTMSELTLSVVLLTGAGLLIETFWYQQRVDPGFQRDHLLTMQLWLPKAKHATAADNREFYQTLIRGVSALPGVRGASAISYRPFLGMGMGTSLDVEGQGPSRGGDQPASEYRVVTPGFIRVLGQPLIAGRDFTEHDEPDGDGVAIVNESMAHRYWAHQNPIGRRLRPTFRRSDVPWELDASPRWLTVVGVVRDIEGFVPRDRDQSQLYVSSLQFPSSYMFLVVRTIPSPLSVTAAVEAQIRRIDPDQPVSDVRTMDDAISESVPRFDVELLGFFALSAIFLAAIGVYGVSSHGVQQRIQEIGIRLALGAQPRDVLAMIVREAFTMAILSIPAGVLAALALSRVLSGFLEGITQADVRVYAGVVVLLFVVALSACYLPARRAAQVDPAMILRS